MIDLDAIRARDQSPYMRETTWLSQSEEDRRALLAYVDALREAASRAERKLSAYVGVCSGDKELTNTVLPMLRAALKRQP